MSFSEMFCLGLLGLVIFGPKRLSFVAKEAGKVCARLKKVGSTFQSQLEAEISGEAREHSTEHAPVATSVDK